MALIPDDPKQRNALVVGILTAALFYVFWAYWYSPRKVAVEELGAQVEQLESQNQRAQIISARGGSELEERLALYERHVGRLERLIPQEEEFAALLNDITAESRRNGVEIATMRPEPEEVGAFYTKKSYELEVIGDYHNIGRFLGAIASLPRIITPKDLELMNFQGDDTVLNPDYETPLTARLRIQTYLLSAANYVLPVEGGEGQEGATS
ncbi:MAG: type 4a pilus biogenesis protein PilO [Gemmatimonadota bacterium]